MAAPTNYHELGGLAEIYTLTVLEARSLNQSVEKVGSF
jgi:hypothetical protein